MADNTDTLDKILDKPEALGRSITRRDVIPLTTCAISELELYRAVIEIISNASNTEKNHEYVHIISLDFTD